MVSARKLIGYYISKNNKCLKAYVHKSKQVVKKNKVKYSKTKYSGSGTKLSTKIKVFKKKTSCKTYLKAKKAKEAKSKKVKDAKKAKSKAKKDKSKAKKAKVSKSRFGKTSCVLDTKFSTSPYFGANPPFINPYASGTPNTGFSSSAWMWPAGIPVAVNKQHIRFVK